MMCAGCEPHHTDAEKPSEERQRPIFVARNLYFLLDELEFPNVEKLNEALWPYWPILWRSCARGHYFHHALPLHDPNSPAGNLDTAYHPHYRRLKKANTVSNSCARRAKVFPFGCPSQEDFPRFIRGRISKDFGVQDDPRTA